jgi:hypothetical protein
LHNWPDLIGQHISLDKKPWPSPSGLTEAQFYGIRQMCVLADWRRAAGRQVARPKDHEQEWAQLDVVSILAQAVRCMAIPRSIEETHTEK